ncbi:hypothetical protein BZL30_7901 [Mycobacterium kansasii]|uniref:Uncharacterized protein n=1 Tax=Mycobacterium kansasii TaxID=1768 RepID=A0A1V3WKR0_MYCKA|nr:hypothetical protein BZL30_7901 [Mycobacterium kansasii]
MVQPAGPGTLFRLVPVGSGWFRLVPVGSGWFRSGFASDAAMRVLWTNGAASVPASGVPSPEISRSASRNFHHRLTFVVRAGAAPNPVH